MSRPKSAPVAAPRPDFPAPATGTQVAAQSATAPRAAQAAAPPSPTDRSWRANLAWLRERLRRRFSADLADDLAQETYLRLVGRDPPVTADAPRGLLMTTATNLARDGFRRDRVRAAFVAGTPGPDVDPFAHDAADDLAVRDAILRLPPKLRDVLLLSKIAGLTNREIAQRYREDEIEAWRASRDHSLPRPERVSPPSQARDRAPDAIKRTNEMKAAAAAESASGQASPQPSCPGEKLQVAAARPPVRRRSQHAQAIAQQMLLDF
ncbi:MAG: hypothetical protein DI570_09780 [Phenylobacterium zucineum]|nr:MAG: hypothetical protein DI570_09780 [Phenylobacterium zucineum]